MKVLPELSQELFDAMMQRLDQYERDLEARFAVVDGRIAERAHERTRQE